MNHPLYPPSAPQIARWRREPAPTQRGAMRAHAVTAR
jgi:hypothetical protein